MDAWRKKEVDGTFGAHHETPRVADALIGPCHEWETDPEMGELDFNWSEGRRSAIGNLELNMRAHDLCARAGHADDTIHRSSSADRTAKEERREDRRSRFRRPTAFLPLEQPVPFPLHTQAQHTHTHTHTRTHTHPHARMRKGTQLSEKSGYSVKEGEDESPPMHGQAERESSPVSSTSDQILFLSVPSCPSHSNLTSLLMCFQSEQRRKICCLLLYTLPSFSTRNHHIHASIQRHRHTRTPIYPVPFPHT
mmetsp:Transcript_39692/g.78188  ORF Transcript_39692/g.78188 Transcript_39692/m.78188 type:complete len:251 (-) Transcript_39692:1061-1813(-)